MRTLSDGGILSIKQIPRFFRRNQSFGVISTEPGDYIFAYEDRSIHAKARESLSFVQHDTYKIAEDYFDDKPFNKSHALDFSPAFEYAEDHPTDAKPDVASHYRTIFTYSEPSSFAAHPVYEEPALSEHTAVSFGLGWFLRTLSVVFFVLFFPLLCWIFIKHLAEHERLIVFRLGRRLKTRGPGFVFILPFCDQYHSVRLDEQTLEVQPVSGGTSDESLVEVHFNVVYHLADPDCAYLSAKEAPSKLVTTQSQLCILSSLKRLSWKQLNDGGARQDLAMDSMVTLNCRCGTYGIQISQINIKDVRLLHLSSSSETTKTLKRLQLLSSALLPQPSGHEPSPASILNRGSLTDLTSNTVRSDSSSGETKEAGTPPALTTATQNVLTWDDPAESNIPFCSSEGVCKLAISRAHPFLSNPLVRVTLGGSTLQLVVSPIAFVPPLPSLSKASKADCYTLAYLDSKRGIASIGRLPSEIPPDVTLYLSASSLLDVLNGRLDLKHAAEKQIIFVQGNTAAFDKLRHLFYLRPG